MNPWIRLLGLLAAIVVAALFLRVLPPLVVLALFVAGVAYANHVLTVVPKRERSRGTAEALGLRPVPAEEAGLSGYPFALLHRPGAATSEVMAGPWRGSEIRLFDLETVVANPIEGDDDRRRFSGAIAPLPFQSAHVVVEPHGFLTPGDQRPDLPAVTSLPPRLASSFDARSADPGFAAGLLDARVVDWLASREERTAFETYGQAVLVYEPWAPAKDRDLLLEAVQGLLDAIEARGGSVGA